MTHEECVRKIAGDNLKYACSQKYFDDGKVKTEIYIVPASAHNQIKYLPRYDLYIDIFNSLKEAQAFEAECLEA